jgi:hypothetical protein
MRKRLKILIVAASFALAAVIPLVIFNIRAPVLIVTEQSFIELYGEKRLSTQAFYSSVALFRSVKTVAVANDAGDDIVPFAVAEISVRPYCVLFPLRFAQSAQLYRELNPKIPVVLLEGRYPENENPAEKMLGADKSEYFIYKTDINDDFYMASLAVSTLKPAAEQKKDDSASEPSSETVNYGKVAVFLDRNMTQMKDIFLRGLYDRGVFPETQFFNSFSQYLEMPDLSCVVITGVGFEYMDKKTGIPVICFTWIDPLLLPSDVVMVVNDSPWAQARQAVKMVAAGEKNALLKSEFLILNMGKFDRELIALIKKTR